jgi:erythromycin esterase
MNDWLAEHVRPFPLDHPQPLPPVLRGAAVVGIASAVRSTREHVLATHRLLEALVDDGVRAVAIEGTDRPFRTAAAWDRWVRTGEGDPDALLAQSQGFLHHAEAAAVFRRLRDHAEQHPDDPVRVVHDPDDDPEPADRQAVEAYLAGTDLESVEAELARRDLDWHRRTGQRVAHWGGTAHVVVGDPRVLPATPWETHRNAGGRLRAELGDGYRVVALTVGRGSLPFPVPAVSPTFAEALLDGAAGPVVLTVADALDPDAPGLVRAWAEAPLVTRMVGPVYDPLTDTDFRIEAGPVHEAVDVLVHIPVGTAVNAVQAGKMP